MYIDKDDFTAWMERIMDRFDMQDKKIDRVIKGRNCLDGGCKLNLSLIHI